MEDYLEGAIRHAIGRGEHLLSLIPADLSREFHALAQKCTDEISKTIVSLRKLLNPRSPDKLPGTYRAYRRAIRDLECFELRAISALNRNDRSDRRMSRVIDSIRREIRHPLPVSPAVTSLSPDYFEILTDLNLLRVPLGEENFLLHLPDLYHELAHPLLVQDNYHPQVKPFKRALMQSYMRVAAYIQERMEKSVRRRETEAFRYQLSVWNTCWAEGWLVEFYCDLYAVCTIGPAYGWSHLHLCARKSESLFEVPAYLPDSHPSDDARMRVILVALDQLGFSVEAERIQTKWDDFIRLRGEATEPDYHLCYPRKLLMEITDEAVRAVREMNVRLAAPATSDLIHITLNQAWEEFWKDPATYVEWEKKAVNRLRDSCSRTID
jgi:hypothetical protein